MRGDLVAGAGEAEVADLEGEPLVEHDVVRLDVAARTPPRATYFSRHGDERGLRAF